MNSVFVLKNGGHVVVVRANGCRRRVGSQHFIASEPIVLHLQAGRCVSKVIQTHRHAYRQPGNRCDRADPHSVFESLSCVAARPDVGSGGIISRERSDSLVVNLSRAIWRAAQMEMLEALLKAQGASTSQWRPIERMDARNFTATEEEEITNFVSFCGSMVGSSGLAFRAEKACGVPCTSKSQPRRGRHARSFPRRQSSAEILPSSVLRWSR